MAERDKEDVLGYFRGRQRSHRLYASPPTVGPGSRLGAPLGRHRLADAIRSALRAAHVLLLPPQEQGDEAFDRQAPLLTGDWVPWRLAGTVGRTTCNPLLQ
jgi:hypothetical protein